jgi:two-component system chemotaxis response regulator CheY
LPDSGTCSTSLGFGVSDFHPGSCRAIRAPRVPHRRSLSMAKTIFLVDDSATILLSVSSILAKAGFAVEKAANADEALKKFNAGVKVDLLITDLNMPGMNGIELIRKVRTLAAYRFLPILFLTTESQQSRKLEAKAAGASGWIVKPATADELLNTIKLVIR